MALSFIDTHSHICDHKFDADREEVLSSLPGKGLLATIDIACELGDFERVRDMTKRYPFVYAAYGIHPHVAADPGEAWEAKLRAALKYTKAVALGEIGLDYHYDLEWKEAQKRVFARQIEIAREEDMPVSLHIREAHGDALSILKEHREGLRGVMHCFSGSSEVAREFLELGLYIAFGGAVTFENARKLSNAAKYVPDDRLLVETDCPYMTPVPYRGERNDPSKIPAVIEKLAFLRETTPERIAELTTENAKRLFKI